VRVCEWCLRQSEPDHDQDLAGILHKRPNRAFASLRCTCGDEGFRFMQRASHLQGDEGKHCADDKRDAPIPRPHLFRSQEKLLQNEQDEEVAELTSDKLT
jgi:hypothetical protein